MSNKGKPSNTNPESSVAFTFPLGGIYQVIPDTQEINRDNPRFSVRDAS